MPHFHMHTISVFILALFSHPKLALPQATFDPATLIQGDALRVSFVGPENRSIFCKHEMLVPGVCEDSDGDGRSDWDGTLIALYDELVTRAGFTMTETAISSTAKAQSSSRWSQCVHDVQNDNIDLCVGDFYLTPERWTQANFVTPYSSVLIGMWVPPGAVDNSFSAKISKTFAPFEASLWLIIILGGALASLLYVIFEADHNLLEFPKGATLHENVKKSLYMAILSTFVRGKAVQSPRTDEGRFLILGFGFFVLMTVSSYTAMMAATLTAVNTPVYQNVADAVAKNARFCGTHSIEPAVRSHYPHINYVAGSSFTARFNHWKEDQCDVILDSMGQSSLGKLDGYCGWNVIGEPLLSLPVSQPVKSVHEMQSLSFHVTALNVNGVVEKIKDEYKQSIFCGSTLDDGTTSSQMGTSEMMGAITTYCSFIALSLISFVKKRFWHEHGIGEHYKRVHLREHFHNEQYKREFRREAHRRHGGKTVPANGPPGTTQKEIEINLGGSGDSDVCGRSGGDGGCDGGFDSNQLHLAAHAHRTDGTEDGSDTVLAMLRGAHEKSPHQRHHPGGGGKAKGAIIVELATKKKKKEEEEEDKKKSNGPPGHPPFDDGGGGETTNPLAIRDSRAAKRAAYDKTQVEALFRKFDKDNSGTLDKEEVNSLASALNMELTVKSFFGGTDTAKLDEAVAEMDSKGDGSVSLQEFFVWYEARMKELEGPTLDDVLDQINQLRDLVLERAGRAPQGDGGQILYDEEGIAVGEAGGMGDDVEC